MEVKVLLVDDEQDFVDALGERLESRGFTVRKALSGEEALVKLREQESDVVLLDVVLPGKDGIQTLIEIKHLNPMIEVMMLTGHGTVDTALDGLKLGAYDYSRKPTDINELSNRIQRAYERKVEQEESMPHMRNDKIGANNG